MYLKFFRLLNKNTGDFESKIREIIPYVNNSDYEFLLKKEYDSDEFSLNFGLNTIQFDQSLRIFLNIFKNLFYHFITVMKDRSVDKIINVENLFRSLIINNKIEFVKNYNFTELYSDENRVGILIVDSIKLNNHEFLNLLLKQTGIKLEKCIKKENLIELYIEVKIIIKIN